MNIQNLYNDPANCIRQDSLADALIALLFRHGLKVPLEVSEIEEIREAAMRSCEDDDDAQSLVRRWSQTIFDLIDDINIPEDLARETATKLRRDQTRILRALG